VHERALISSKAWELLDLVGDSKVASVTLALGPDIDPMVVAEAWRSATASTPLADARLESVTQNHLLLCLDCGREFEGNKLSVCPECTGNGLVVTPAPEVELDTWTMSREDA
jgi:Zn finger protein HypA/HybF involved in hydrogenase expression